MAHPSHHHSSLPAEPCIAEFLAERFGQYLELVREAEAHPENRSGADKTWVERAMQDYQQHYRDARPAE